MAKRLKNEKPVEIAVCRFVVSHCRGLVRATPGNVGIHRLGMAFCTGDGDECRTNHGDAIALFQRFGYLWS